MRRVPVVTQISKALLLTRRAVTPPCSFRGGPLTNDFHRRWAVVKAALLSALGQLLGSEVNSNGAVHRPVVVSRVASKCGRLSSS